MRKLLFLVSMLIMPGLYAQYKVDMRFRVMPKFNFSIPLGSFANGSANSETSPVGTGIGGGFTWSMPIYKDLIAGMNFNYQDYQFDKAKILGTYKARYQAPDFYVEVRDIGKLSIQTVNQELSYRFYTKHIEIEPYLGLGLTFVYNTSRPYIKRKMVNDNYREVITLRPDEPVFFSKAFGLRLNKPIVKWVYAVASFGYSYGRYEMKFEEITNDYFGTLTTRKYSINQTVSALQAEIGLQVRAGEFPKK